MTTEPTRCPNDEVWEDHEPATECTCTTDCGDPGEAGCCFCNHTDVYEPCPVVGFGCGGDARPYVWCGEVKTNSQAARCDCCTDEQWAAASTPSAETVAAIVGVSS